LPPVNATGSSRRDRCGREPIMPYACWYGRATLTPFPRRLPRLRPSRRWRQAWWAAVLRPPNCVYMTRELPAR
jgi:hypothetical protein